MTKREAFEIISINTQIAINNLIDKTFLFGADPEKEKNKEEKALKVVKESLFPSTHERIQPVLDKLAAGKKPTTRTGWLLYYFLNTLPFKLDGVLQTRACFLNKTSQDIYEIGTRGTIDVVSQTGVKRLTKKQVHYFVEGGKKLWKK